LPRCSDLAYARATLLGYFSRSEDTHAFWVDSDQGWDAHDVVRMLLAKKDVVAGISCMKKYPLEWAVSNDDDDGNLLTFEPWIEHDIPLLTVNFVGMAFMMMEKECIKKLIDHYPEQNFPAKGITECALFDPLIIKGKNGHIRRLSEDFAFCWRLRNAGFKIHVIPDIHLQHIGSHTFEGKWCDSFKPLMVAA